MDGVNETAPASGGLMHYIFTNVLVTYPFSFMKVKK
jgi:hypothetical protein